MSRSATTGNPPVTGDLSALPTIATMLRRACYNCHSNETRWPWYGRVAPVSWFTDSDVTRARRELNFSECSGYFPQTRTRKLQWMERSIDNGKMPPVSYSMMHLKARLDARDSRGAHQLDRIGTVRVDLALERHHATSYHNPEIRRPCRGHGSRTTRYAAAQVDPWESDVYPYATESRGVLEMETDNAVVAKSHSEGGDGTAAGTSRARACGTISMN
jgi:Haem-binding domain